MRRPCCGVQPRSSSSSSDAARSSRCRSMGRSHHRSTRQSTAHATAPLHGARSTCGSCCSTGWSCGARGTREPRCRRARCRGHSGGVWARLARGQAWAAARPTLVGAWAPKRTGQRTCRAAARRTLQRPCARMRWSLTQPTRTATRSSTSRSSVRWCASARRASTASIPCTRGSTRSIGTAPARSSCTSSSASRCATRWRGRGHA
mmetsp:Transcript_51382/g.151469  ORF Transcript_51382/g.151469 Transcript_51382/m.151469 type:complete len:205 (+) Transcript_51382:599-1213(+)